MLVCRQLQEECCFSISEWRVYCTRSVTILLLTIDLVHFSTLSINLKQNVEGHLQQEAHCLCKDLQIFCASHELSPFNTEYNLNAEKKISLKRDIAMEKIKRNYSVQYLLKFINTYM